MTPHTDDDKPRRGRPPKSNIARLGETFEALLDEWQTMPDADKTIADRLIIQNLDMSPNDLRLALSHMIEDCRIKG